MVSKQRTLVIGCGALARELLHLQRLNDMSTVTVECLPAWLHNRPEKIPAAVAERIERAGDEYDRIFVGYADCGTAGRLDDVIAEAGVERLPGAHCYEFFAGTAVFAELHDEEPGTFYLTDYLTRYFDRLVFRGLGLDRHPELFDDYFGNYRRIVYLAQTDAPHLTDQARSIAARLGLTFERRFTGYGDLEEAMVRLEPAS